MTKPRDLGRQWKIKDFTAIGCQQIHKNVISCIPISNITAENWQISKCYITALNKKFSISKKFSDIEWRHRNYGIDSRKNELILAPGNIVWYFCISKCLISHKKRIQIFLRAKPEGFQNKLLGYVTEKTPSMLKAAQEETFLLNSTYKPYQGSIFCYNLQPCSYCF